jgi:hypothetical protein
MRKKSHPKLIFNMHEQCNNTPANNTTIRYCSCFINATNNCLVPSKLIFIHQNQEKTIGTHFQLCQREYSTEWNSENEQPYDYFSSKAFLHQMNKGKYFISQEIVFLDINNVISN